MCERQINIPNCEDKLKHRISNKYYGKGDTYLIQPSHVVATYDNSVSLEFDNINFGELSYDSAVNSASVKLDFTNLLPEDKIKL